MQPWAVSALVLGEQVFVRRVVLVDQELVGEVEADAAERIAGAWRLRNVYGAVGVLSQFQADAIEGGTFQVGLTVMNFISALTIGVALPGFPATILVCQ